MRKLACKAALPRGKKHDNTITPPHVSTKSLSVTSGDSSVCLVVSETADGAGLWISDAQDSLKGIAIYRNKEQMAIGLRSGKGILAAALSVDAATGEGQLQLTQASGETVVLTATEIVTAVKALTRLCPCPVPAKAAKAAKAAKPKVKAAKPKVKAAKLKVPRVKKDKPESSEAGGLSGEGLNG